MTNAEITNCEDRLVAAMLTSDVGELDQLISPRLMFVGPGGATFGKGADLEAHRSKVMTLSTLSVLDRQIDLSGSVAVVNVVVEMNGSFAGQSFSGRFRYLRIWAQENEGIRVIAGSVCAVV